MSRAPKKTSRDYDDLALSVYLAEIVQDRRILFIGGAQREGAAERLASTAASVDVVSPHARARGTRRGGRVSQRPWPNEGDRGRYDVIVVPDLVEVELLDSASVRDLRAWLAPGGLLIAGAPAGDRRRRAELSYEGLFDLLAGEFEVVRMVGQAPFAGTSLVDFSPTEEELEVTFDGSLLDEQGERANRYLAFCGSEPVVLDAYAIVQLPSFAVRAPSEGELGGRDVARLEALELELEAQRRELEAKQVELEAQRRELDSGREELEARQEELDSSNLHAEGLERELERLKSEGATREQAELSGVFERIDRLGSALRETEERLEASRTAAEERIALSEAHRQLAEARAQQAEEAAREARAQTRSAEEMAAEVEAARVAASEEAWSQAEEELRRLEGALFERAKELTELRAEVERRAILVRDLVEDLAEARAAAEAVEPAEHAEPSEPSEPAVDPEKLEQLRAALSQAAERALAAEAEQAKLSFRLDELQGALAILERQKDNKIDALRRKEADLEGRLRGLALRNAELEDRWQQTRAMLAGRASVSDMLAELERLREGEVAAAEREGLLTGRLMLARETLMRARETLTRVVGERDAFSARAQRLGEELEEARGELESQRARSEDLSVDISRAQRAEERENALSAQIAAQDAELSSLRGEIAGARARLAERELALATLRARVDAAGEGEGGAVSFEDAPTSVGQHRAPVVAPVVAPVAEPAEEPVVSEPDVLADYEAELALRDALIARLQRALSDRVGAARELDRELSAVREGLSSAEAVAEVQAEQAGRESEDLRGALEEAEGRIERAEAERDRALAALREARALLRTLIAR